jgi:hypothetical protein
MWEEPDAPRRTGPGMFLFSTSHRALVRSRMTSATKKASSVRDIAQNCPAFGSRFLTEEQDVWAHNAWDHVPPPTDQGELIAASLARQRAAPVAEPEKAVVNEKPAKHWDNFYKNNADNFFKDRKWCVNCLCCGMNEMANLRAFL